ncbi:MAG TPA: DUF2264 domain-containing protein [Candidatus Limiplasma sp.]|nr:DUF2264 domain-containing protein [Candidatus Limiplasma sp.]
MIHTIGHNPMKTRHDVEQAAMEMLNPLLSLLSPGCARLHLGDTGAYYPASIAEMEAFARPLWAIIPMLAGQCECVLPVWEKWKQGIISGSDPGHPEYWGDVQDYDQRLVEMAVFGMGMAMIPETFFFTLPKSAQENLYRWLNQINQKDMPKNNWVFFRVLVNMGFEICGLPFDQKRLNEDFALIDAHYEGDGWYYDYMDQRDYYIPWAFQFYGLVYSHLMPHTDNAQKLIERAKLFAPDFACWFAASGEAIPFGRSLTYRFAQSAFFAAQAYAGAITDRIGYGEMKYILLQNFRNWFQQPIFTRDGVLTIGYHYPNLIMAEGYNAPGSPYWGMKTFLCLAMPDSHPFWQAEEIAPVLPDVSPQTHARQLIVRTENGGHVTAYQAGNHCVEHSHSEAKYEKFAYSTAFGFSVSKSRMLLKAGAFDSMLAVSPDGVSWHPRYGCESFAINEHSVVTVWKPMPGVTVKTEIIPIGMWHVRRHYIHTDTEIMAAEGAFAIGAEGGSKEIIQGKGAAVITRGGITGIKALQGYGSAAVIWPEPNTNLMAPRTLLPMLSATLKPGEHTLVCAVLGSVSDDFSLWQTIPGEVSQLG